MTTENDIEAQDLVEEPNEYTIHEASLPWLDRKFDRMRKVAKEVGAEPPS